MRSTERNSVSVLERSFRLLREIGTDGRRLGLTELARRSDLPKATAYRLAGQLVSLGVLEHRNGGYQLGLGLFELGSAVATQRRLREAALPFLEDLYEATHETVHLGILDGLDVLYIEKIVGRRRAPVRTLVGMRKPLYCTGLGKAILAYSPPALLEQVLGGDLVKYTAKTITSAKALRDEVARIRSTGVAYDHGEYNLGIACVAAALLDVNGQARAAISITGPFERFQPETAGAAVRAAVAGLTRTLGAVSWPL